jgi:hypothetical protein
LRGFTKDMGYVLKKECMNTGQFPLNPVATDRSLFGGLEE